MIALGPDDSMNANEATFNFPTGMLNWTAGTIFGDFTNIGDLTIAGTNPNSLDVGNTLTNTGKIEFDNSLSIGDQYTGSAGAFLDNELQGTITVTAGVAINGGTFNNSGTLNVIGGGTTTLNVTNFNNLDAPINISGGTLVDQAGGTSTGATFAFAAAAEFEIIGTSTWNGAYSGTGAGSVVIALGVDDSMDANAATFSFPTGMLNWTAGPIFGDFTNLGDLTIAGTNPDSLDVVNTLTNSGTIELDNTLGVGDQYTGSAGAFLDNEAQGTITVLGGVTINGQTFNNLGTLDVIGGGTTTINVQTFNLQGSTIDVAQNSTFDLTNSNFDVSGSIKGSGAGTIDFTPAPWPLKMVE